MPGPFRRRPLYARLRGRSGRAEVLAGFLHALGVPPAGVPPEPDERAALFRELLAARRVLIVIDDVSGAAEIEPLLPAEPRCAVLLTSRQRLSAAGPVRVVPLEALPPDAGTELFRSIAGDGDPAGTAEAVRLCGGLPLAIRGRGHRRPSAGAGGLAPARRPGPRRAR
ncbi:NB-ARC domain-containing protein [Actinomadura sp. 21ATH]|uniref:NB-ARC domain-containing protein n=1 Tax=Actinomadura sp. 21ATH TaxID=1735444 RepID=UPI0035C25C7D